MKALLAALVLAACAPSQAVQPQRSALLLDGGIDPANVLVDLTAGTFTRANAATYRTAPDQSSISTAAVDVRRFEDRGDSLGALLLVERNAWQYVKATENIGSTAWGKTNVTVTADAVAAPDGATTADAIAATVSNTPAYVGQTMGIKAAPHGRFGGWLRSGTSSTASVYISDGTTTVDVDVALTTTWSRWSVQLDPFVNNPVVRIRPHAAASPPTAGDSVYPWGWNFNTSSTGVWQERAYFPVLATTVAHTEPEYLYYAANEYDQRILDAPFAFWWVPEHDVANQPDDHSFFSFGSLQNEVLWANNDDAVRIRARSNATKCNTTAMDFGADQPMVVFVDPTGVDECVHVFGAQSGGDVSTDQTFTWPNNALRVAGRYGDQGQHALDGRISAPFAVSDMAEAEAIFDGLLVP